MFWLWFDTPSIKDLKKVKELSEKIDKKKFLSEINISFNWNSNDFLKIIVNDIWEILWIFNKINKKYLLFNDDINLENKVKKIIKFKYKI